MSTFVIVHGGWGGGWEWSTVARKLRERGHDVFTPTLTGLGERSHLIGPGTGLFTHIDDVVGVIEFEELDDVILCGHSYGGMVVTGVADRVPECIRLLVYVDAVIPRDGQSILDALPLEFADVATPDAGASGVTIPDALLPPEGSVDEAKRQSYMRRLRPHPVASFKEKLRLSGAIDKAPRAFVRCTADDELLEPFADRAREEGWLWREIETAHDLQLLQPDETAAILDDLARAA